MRGGTLLILGHGVKGQGQLCPPARGCHALRCLVTCSMQTCTYYVQTKSYLGRTMFAMIIIPPATKLGGGILESPCPSVCLSVRLSSAFGFPAHNCFPFTPIIMKLHMQTPHESRMCPIDFEVKGQRPRSQCINYWKWFRVHNCFPFTPIIMILHMQTPHEARMCPIDFEVKRSKVKVTMHKLLKMVSGTLLLSLYTYHHETSHADSPWGKDVPYRFWGQKVKGQGHNA